ncbi:MAG: hypothetical protein AAF467_16995 [Actinomycetota bacterium]
MRRRPIWIAVAAAMAMVLASCGTDDGGNGEATAVVGGDASDTTLADGGADDGAGSADDGSGDGGDGDDDGAADGDGDAGDTGGDDGDGSGAADDDGDGDTTTELPGTPFDIGPPAGEPLDVVGVRFDDSLNFREGPGVNFPIVDDVPSLAATPEIVSAGEGRLLDQSAWWRVTVGGADAWASFRFLGVLGNTESLLADLDPAIASLETADVQDLITAVAESRGGGGPEPRITQVQEPAGLAGGQTSYVVDVLDLGDDALAGERLSITVEEGPGGFTLVGLERTFICNRGVSDGLCL